MKRKLIKQGAGALTITLPKQWIEKHNLKSGDIIDLEASGGILKVSCEKRNCAKTTHLDFTDNDILITRCLGCAYRAGYDKVELAFSGANTFRKIQHALKEYLIGYEIIKHSKNSCTIKNISLNVDEEAENALRRSFLLLQSMANESLDALKTENKQMLQEATLIDESINKFTCFYRRILNLKGYKDYEKTTFVYAMVEELERIGDEYKYLNQFFLEGFKKLKLSEEAKSFYEETNTFLKDLYELFYKFNLEKANQAAMKRKRLIVCGTKLIKKASKREAEVLNHLMIIVQKIFIMLNYVLAVNI